MISFRLHVVRLQIFYTDSKGPYTHSSNQLKKLTKLTHVFNEWCRFQKKNWLKRIMF
jgi:hypothetical protein